MKFHDGSPLTVDDVVFSVERSQQPTSQHAVFTQRLGKAVRIDDRTLELKQDKPNPVLLVHLQNVLVMSRAWCVEHRSERVPSSTDKEEAYSTTHAMGTGAWILRERQPGVRTVLARNPDHWRAFEGNLDELVHTPIGNDATRTAALVSGDIDFAQDVPPQDLDRLAANTQLRLTQGVENRIIFLGLDVARDELVYSNVKGRNPLKDVRVREAMFHAIDAGLLQSKVMRGRSQPTACMAVAASGCEAPELEAKRGEGTARARRLMEEAGYASGFELTLHCPNDRYVNDQALCLALAPMLAQIGIRLKVETKPKSLFFPQMMKRDTSFYLYGWGGNAGDAQFALDPLLHAFDERTQKGGDNNGGIADAELDRLIDAAGIEIDEAKRKALLREAQLRVHRQFWVLPLHRQMLTWGSRANVRPVLMPGNTVRPDWFRME